jgi:hypothetical protein
MTRTPESDAAERTACVTCQNWNRPCAWCAKRHLYTAECELCPGYERIGKLVPKEARR